MYYIEVIHIPSVVPYLESSFYHVVKLVQIDIAEELTGEVADRQSDALWLAKQALGRWQQHPFLLVAHHLAVQCVVFEDDAFYKEENKLRILSRDVTVLAFLFPLLHEFVVNNTVEDVLVDAHEIALNVQFEDIGCMCIVAVAAHVAHATVVAVAITSSRVDVTTR